MEIKLHSSFFNIKIVNKFCLKVPGIDLKYLNKNSTKFHKSDKCLIMKTPCVHFSGRYMYINMHECFVYI